MFANQKMPKISIIVPVFNASQSIERCVESILSQKYKNFELILIDDNSADNSYEICKKYTKKDPRIILSKHKQNLGVSKTRNTGLKIAQGEWIAFVDSDDTVSADWLSAFSIDDVQNVDMLVHPILWIQNGGEKEIKFVPQNKDLEQNILELYKLKLLGFVWAIFLKRDIICSNKLLFDERLIAVEDLEFMSRYVKFVRNIGHTNIGKYYYTFINKPHRNTLTNVYCRIFSNLQNIFTSPVIKREFIQLSLPHILRCILYAAYYNATEFSRLISWYKNEVNPPLFMFSINSKLTFFANLSLKLNLICILNLMSKLLCKSNTKFKYIRFDINE